MRCSRCRKKIIIEYDCKCSLKLCLDCLPFFKHNCTYDYKLDKQQHLEENNPKIVAIKVLNL